MKVLIKSKREELKKVSKILAKNFMNDPLYEYIFEGKEYKERAMEIFFEAYLKFLLPYSDLIVDSDDMNLVGVAWFSERMKSSTSYFFEIVQFVFRMLKLIPVVGFDGTFKLIKTIQKMSSTWIDNHVEKTYCHLDLAVISPENRGRGLFTSYIDYVESIYSNGVDYYTLETQNFENIKKYEHLGFSIVEEILLEGTELVQYCMVKKVVK